MAEFYDVVIKTEVKHRRNVKPDALHWNSIEKKLEYWDGAAWVEVGANLDELKNLLDELETELRTDLEEGDRASLEAAGQAVQAAAAALETANAAKTSADAKVATVNGKPPDENGNVEAGGLPLGFEYFQTNPNVQAGSLPMVGGEWSRMIYADLWEWVQKQEGYLITEAEWQEKAAANGGAVPFYSDGDGATTFRVPALTVWCKGKGGNEAVGDYLAGMFESHKHSVTVSDTGAHTHTRGTMNITGSVTSNDSNYYWGAGTTASGAFSDAYVGGSKVNSQSWSGSRGNGFRFNAADTWTGETSSNGSHSHTVTLAEQGGEETRPRTIVGLYCVVAYGTVTSGAIDLDDVRDLLMETQEVASNVSTVREDTVAAAQDAASASAGESGTVTLEGVAAEVAHLGAEVEGKAETDLSNLSTAGRSLAAGLGMPSSRYVDLTLGASETAYTAPANGWFALSTGSMPANSYLSMRLVKNGIAIMSSEYKAATAFRATPVLPVTAGDIVKISYSSPGSLDFFRFIYAEGEV